MPQIINTNIASLTAQRNLNSSQNSLNTSLQRLSSGLRINSAKDDAAGLAISERFTTQIRGLNQASRNANDAISLSQTAEGALGEIGTNLQRIRELAVQSANATNSASDRAALDLEVQQRLEEVDRIASQTSFNGQKIIDGSFGTAAFQVGANVGETISLDLTTSITKDKIGEASSVSSSADISAAFGGTTGLLVGAGELTVAFNGGSAVDVAAGTYSTAADLTTAINTAFVSAGGTGTAATSSGDVITVTNVDSGGALVLAGLDAVTAGIDGTLAAAGASATVDNNITAADFDKYDLSNGGLTVGVAGGSVVTVAAGIYDDAGLAAAINTAYGSAGGTGTLATASGGAVVIDNPDAAGDNSKQVTLAGTETAALGIGANLSLDDDGAGTDTVTIAASVFDKFDVATLTVDLGAGAGAQTVATGAVDAAGLISAINAVATGVATSDGSAGINITNATSNDFTFAGGDAGTLGIGTVSKQFATDVGDSLTTALATVNTSSPLVIASGELDITVGTGTTVSITSPTGGFTSGTQLATAITDSVDGLLASFDTTTNILSFTSSESITVAGTGTVLTGDLNMTAATTAASGSLDTASVSTVAGANDAIYRIDNALTSISDLRSTFGAIQNRFESTISNLSTAVESLSAARSRIQDADFASETAALTRAQILQQAGVSILSQANSLPQSVLGLLQ